MKVIVNEQPQQFYLAYFNKWMPAVGHEIRVGLYQFCAIPLSNHINVSEVTTGTRVLSISIDFEIMMHTATKEGTIEYFEKIGNQLKQLIERTNDFDQQLVKIKQVTYERLGEMPPIEEVDIPAN
ncbi:MAG TPA: hypothetical protein VIG73_08215 [Cerasibacillus sp.]|uniref:hypothetical protein n=1 Tax=Cerasibacillus sp. TaxID=2498711 RepID=UPI002F3EC3AE